LDPTRGLPGCHCHDVGCAAGVTDGYQKADEIPFDLESSRFPERQRATDLIKVLTDPGASCELPNRDGSEIVLRGSRINPQSIEN
jgi:hypothetical protein